MTVAEGNGRPERTGLVDATGNRAGHAIGCKRPQCRERHVTRFLAQRTSARCQHEDRVAIDRRVNGADRPGETILRHDRYAARIRRGEIGIGGDDADGGVAAGRSVCLGARKRVERGRISPATDWPAGLARSSGSR